MTGKKVAVIGGGIAGLEAASELASFGFDATIVEKQGTTGGNVGNWDRLFPSKRHAAEVTGYLKEKLDGKVQVLTSCEVERTEKNGSAWRLFLDNKEVIDADAILVATGFDLFDTRKKEEYGYGIYENVYSSADLEKMFRAAEVKLKNGTLPQKIGMVHCVGSRDEKSGNIYCSKLCCVTAVKQAIELREMLPASKVFCFYMDMRMGGAHYEELYLEAQEKHSVNFIRGKVSEVGEAHNGKLIVKVEDTLAGRPLRMELDMLVLMAGMEMSGGGKEISELLDLDTGDNRFFKSTDNHFGSNMSNSEGVFYAGTCIAPMSIPETISHARAAAVDVIQYLKSAK